MVGGMPKLSWHWCWHNLFISYFSIPILFRLASISFWVLLADDKQERRCSWSNRLYSRFRHVNSWSGRKSPFYWYISFVCGPFYHTQQFCCRLLWLWELTPSLSFNRALACNSLCSTNLSNRKINVKFSLGRQIWSLI